MSVLIAAVALGVGLGWVVSGDGFSWTDAPKALEPRPRLQKPSPALGPVEVVRLQLASLADCGPDERGIAQCFAFASPLNRRATGPLPRFRAMLRRPPYEVMFDQQTTLVGSEVVEDNKAVVLVTIIGPNRKAHAFRFFLTKQQQPPYADCWMTDAVVQVGTSGSAADPARRPRRPAVQV